MGSNNQSESLRLLEENFSDHTDIIPTLLFARSERFRIANLNDVGTTTVWTGTNLRVGLPTTGENVVPVFEQRSVNWVPYAYDADADMWQSVQLADYWAELERRNPVDALRPFDDDPTNDVDERRGILGIVQLGYSAYFQGISNITNADDPSAFEPVFDPDETADDSYYNFVRELTDNPYYSFIGAGGRGGSGLLATILESVLNNSVLDPNIIVIIGTYFSNLRSAGSDIARSSLVESLRQWVNTNLSVIRIVGFVAVALLVLALITLVIALVFLLLGTDIFAIIGDFLDSEAGRITVLVVVVAISAVFVLLSGITAATLALQSLASLVTFGVLASSTKTKLTSALRTSAIATIVISIIITIVVIIFFIVTVVQNDISPGSVQFTQLLAFSIATILAVVLISSLAVIPYIGPILTGLIGIVDTILAFFGLPTFTELLTRAVFHALYGFTPQVDVANIETVEGSVTLLPEDASRGFRVGNTIYFAQTIRTFAHHRTPDSEAWQAFVYPFLYTRDNFTSTFVNYSLSLQPDAESLDGRRGDTRNQWRNVRSTTRSNFFAAPSFGYEGTYDQALAVGGIPLTTAGINMSPEFHQNYRIHAPALECWSVPIPFPLPPFYAPFPICYVRDNDPITGSSAVGQNLTLDVFPATFTEFVAFAGASNSNVRLAWDEQFPGLLDADGDGLRASNLGGIDPNDTTWDTDGDGLSDMLEAEARQNGIYVDLRTSDFDGDGLTDRQELLFGSNPADPDTDNDGLPDREEVYHQVLVPGFGASVGSWAGGWEVIVNPRTRRTVRVTSNPTIGDSDGDGILDSLEQALASLGFHPRVFNENPVSIRNSISDADGFVTAGDTVTVTNVVANTLPNFFMDGRIQIDVPLGLGGGATTEDINLATDEEQAFVQTLTVPNAVTSQRADINSVIQARTGRDPVTSWRLNVSDYGVVRSGINESVLSLSIDADESKRTFDSYITALIEGNDDFLTGEGRIIGPDRLSANRIWGSDSVAGAGSYTTDMACTARDVPFNCLTVWDQNSRDGRSHFIGGMLIDGSDGSASTQTINQFLTGNSGSFHLRPAVASDGQNFLLVYEDNSDPVVRSIVSVFVGYQGNDTVRIAPSTRTTLGSFLVSDRLNEPSSDIEVVWDGNNYHVVQERNGTISHTRLTSGGSLVTKFIIARSTNFNRPDIAADPENRRVLVVYEQSLGVFNKRIFGRLYNNGVWGAQFTIGNGIDPQVEYDAETESWIVVSRGTYWLLDRNGNLRTTPLSLGANFDSSDLACRDRPIRPLADLRLEEAPGATTFVNRGEIAVNATCSGASCPTAGVLGRPFLSTAASFSSNDLIALPASGALNATQRSATISAWVNPQATDGLHNIVVRENGNQQTFVRIVNGRYSAGFLGSSLVEVTSSIPTADRGRWVFLTAVFNNNIVRLYRDGQFVGEAVGRINQSFRVPNLSGRPWLIGGSQQASNRSFVGSIDDIRIYNTILPNESVQALFEDQRISFCAGVISIRDPNTATPLVRFNRVQVLEERDVLPPLTNNSIAPLVIDTTPPTTGFALTNGQFIPGDETLIIGGAASDDTTPNDNLPGVGVGWSR
ncbi:MAG: LamG domain-containing protein [Chloroflexaceae bacterium]|nr:LamG domain-containing protein [Chloroflexaceae bacterium]